VHPAQNTFRGNSFQIRPFKVLGKAFESIYSRLYRDAAIIGSHLPDYWYLADLRGAAPRALSLPKRDPSAVPLSVGFFNRAHSDAENLSFV
jgi:hypothetical protein